MSEGFIKAIHHCGLVVRDLDRSIYFYHDILGLPFANEPTEWLSGPQLEAGVGVPGASLRQVALWAAAHVCFLVEDVRARKAELEAKGLQFYTDVNVVDDGPLAGWRWVYFSDPDGLALELVEIAYYRKEERDAASARYLRERPSLESIEASLV